MRLFAALGQALMAMIIASPLEPRQGIDTSLVDSAPTPTSVSVPVGPSADTTTYNLTEATESATASPLPVGTEPISRRSVAARQTACQPNPTGAGPVPSPDNDSNFLRFAAFATIASQAPTPSGYNRTFVNLHARSQAYGYLGFDTLNSYDTQGCATQCDTIFDGCQGFNIFFERDPSLIPAPGCANPPSTTNIKCIFWGGDVATDTASYVGENQQGFHIVISGSNGYMRNAVPTVPGYDGEATGNNTIDAPDGDTTGDPTVTTTVTTTVDGTTTTITTTTPTSTANPGNGRGTYIGSRIFTITFFDPALCAAACDAQNRNNLAHPPARGEPQICRFFTTYLINRNGRPAGQYCALYTRYYPRTFATNNGTTDGDETLSVRHAFSYRNTRL
ncbi:uncharacterized protein F4822DRAFT_425031 [Hypoxylon trugodes]|uniref:uncharacterized protein n=1 Tax=Hypoxylon trugodes TaxID=326681 RepID=UPI002194D8DA|nr:uncharacterized protein F4822DRAFT_425031 [Hypoxylon trugodes]KAI1391812.1 hypothetical protein F4822DRAFT_425031 [Hypoxylon trugodes]